MVPNPIREGDLRLTSIRHREDLGNDLGIRAREVIAIQIEKRHHGQKSDALVAVTVRVIPNQAKGVGCRERRQSRPAGMLPFLLGTGQCGFERALVTSPGQAAVFAQLVVVNGVNDETTEPPGLGASWGHAYFASSRRALRYFLAARAAIFSARSTSGS